MTLLSSSKNKIKEFKHLVELLLFNLKVALGKDLPEIEGSMDEVILYKSLDAGKGYLVEDTILIIDGQEVVDIRWNQEDKLKENQKAQWAVSIGYNDGVSIKVFRGIIEGIIVNPIGVGYGFDPYFLPNNSELSLAQLDERGLKDDFSSRKLALEKVKGNNYLFERKISSIPKWEGEYQNS